MNMFRLTVPGWVGPLEASELSIIEEFMTNNPQLIEGGAITTFVRKYYVNGDATNDRFDTAAEAESRQSTFVVMQEDGPESPYPPVEE